MRFLTLCTKFSQLIWMPLWARLVVRLAEWIVHEQYIESLLKDFLLEAFVLLNLIVRPHPFFLERKKRVYFRLRKKSLAFVM